MFTTIVFTLLYPPHLVFKERILPRSWCIIWKRENMFSNPFLLEYLALLLDSMQIHSLTEYWAISPNLVWPPLSKLNHNIQSFPILAFTPFTYSKEQPQYMIYSFPMLFAELLRFFPRKDGSVSIFKCLKLTDWLQQPYFSLLLWKTQISLPQAGLDDLCFSASITEIKKKKRPSKHRQQKHRSRWISAPKITSITCTKSPARASQLISTWQQQLPLLKCSEVLRAVRVSILSCFSYQLWLNKLHNILHVLAGGLPTTLCPPFWQH